MKRQTVYAGQVPLETDLLLTGKNVLTAIGHVLQDMLGTSTLFSGLACVPTAPAGMTVNVNPGRAYSLQAIDTGAWSSLSADAHQIMKQGILLDAQNFSCPAPGTAGFSINYLIQGAFQEVDTGSLVLPYYNASNPSQAYNGPNGTGTSQTTARDNTVQLQLKAGVAATTGSQITPTPDAGFNGLWVVTVPFGASTITSANISQYSGAPFLTASLLSMIQQNGLYAVATGSANAHVAAFSPPITTRTDGMVLRYKAPAANTGALTFNDGLGAVAVVGAAHAALQGGETAVNGDVWLQWNSSIGGGSYVLIDSTGGAVQVAPATQSQHALQLGQATGRLLRTTIYTLVSGVQNVTTIVNGVLTGPTTTGASTFTPLSNMTWAEIEAQGGGGAGAGAGGAGASAVSLGAGGVAGSYGKSRFTAATIGASQAVTIGAGGAAASNTAGSNGGTTSFGALLTAPGGSGGGLFNNVTPPTSNGNSVLSGAPTGANVLSIRRSLGPISIGLTSAAGYGSSGGDSQFGSGAPGPGFNTTGVAAVNPGSGGSGTALNQAGGAAAGGAGAGGILIVNEYA
jgi:hypothetical protein